MNITLKFHFRGFFCLFVDSSLEVTLIFFISFTLFVFKIVFVAPDLFNPLYILRGTLVFSFKCTDNLSIIFLLSLAPRSNDNTIIWILIVP